jgi:NAD(P)-dependent dehydrogenase (short-subunit alcohol dehydrogenase family)
MTFDLSGRVVVVIGAGGGGIGTAIAGAIAHAGAAVVGVDVRPTALEPLEAALAGTPGPHRSVVGDGRRPDDVEAALGTASELGPLHGLVQVAGGQWPDQWSPLTALDPATWDTVVELNLRAPMLSTAAAARRMAAHGGGGSIVLIASLVGLSSMPFGAAYAASKAGVMSLTRTAAVELGPLGIRVNAVAPGSVRTPKSEANTPPAPESEAERTAVPLRRRGSPADIASAALFFLSDHASWVTGQVLAVDGGSAARPSFLDAENVPVFVRDPALRARLAEEAGAAGAGTTGPR